MPERILIADDDPVQRRLLENMVKRAGYETIVVDGGAAAVARLTTADGAPIDAAVLDLMMPDLDGLAVLARIREAGLAVPVIVQTAHGGIDNVVNAMRAGATDFVVKPVGPERIAVSLRNALATRALQEELVRIKRSRSGTLTFKDIITRSDRMRAVLRTAEKAAASAIPVLIEGQSGVGKELIARAVHGTGDRRTKPFVAVNCGAIPDNLVESILFGHEKGAFTGATERHTGKFVEASGGTLFLDEVGELPAAAQVKLLRAIQEGEVEPVGGRRPVKVDVRLISATNRNLTADVATGRFREDLFYRLHVFPISVPPLKERPEDVPELARHFLARFAAEEGKRIARLQPSALSLLAAYHWPGNVRQLENTIFRAVVLADGDEISVDEFPQIASQIIRSVEPQETGGMPPAPEPTEPTVATVSETSGAAPWRDPDRGGDPDARSTRGVEPPLPGAHLLPLLDETGEVRALDAIENDAIRFAIEHYRGQMSEVARRLQIGRSTLYRKLDSMGLAEKDGHGAPSDRVILG
jgi:DNA-binding NtrC family response regulator